jgi:hypothetical protein
MSQNLPGFCKEKKEKFKQKFPGITDNDLRFPEGAEAEMMETLGSKLGKTNQELLYIIIAL